MRIMAIDPSGNWKEGKGTSGFCFMKKGEPILLSHLKADGFPSAEEYWISHLSLIKQYRPDVVVMEGYRLYNHRGMAASSQANSELETVQLIGAVKVFCRENLVPVDIQFASEVKSRWSDDVLVHMGILEKKGNRYYFDNKQTNNHQRDALRHAMHYGRYGRREIK